MSLFRPLVVLALILALWAVVARAASAPAGDLITERGYLNDPGGALGIEEVRAASFTPLSGPLAHGNSGRPVWLRAVIPPQPADHQALVLLIQPASVADVRVYLRDPEGGWQIQQTGSVHPYSTRVRDDLSFALPIQLESGRPTEVFVRVQSHTAVVHLQALTPNEARRFDAQLHIGVGLYLGLALVLMSLSLLMWWSTGDRLWVASAMFDFATLLQVSIPMGLFAKYVIPEAADLLPTVHATAAMMHLVLVCVFFSLLMRVLQSPRWVTLGYLVVLVVVPYWLWLIQQGQLAESQRLVNLWVLWVTLWGVPALWTVGTPDAVLRWIFRVMVGALIAYMLYWVLPLMQFGKASSLSLYPTLPSNLVTMVLMVLLLARRTFLAARERQRLELEKQHVESRFRMEQQHHAETSGMLGMIMHEVKNPLASIRMASELLSSGRVRSAEDQEKRFRNIQDAVDGIDTVLQRCIEVDRLEQGALVEERRGEDVAELLRHWVTNHRLRQRLDESLPESLPAQVDARLMFLILGNLVDNALKYSPAESLITLRLRAAEGAIEVEVRNLAGRAGWPDPNRLFQKYYRSPTAQHGSGTGLGLYWVRKVSEMVGGSVTYRPEGNEVVFVLRMPS